MMQHHIEMCFKSYFFQWMLSRAYMCSVYLECIFRQPTQPTKDLREKKHIFSRIFRDISGRADPPIIGPSGQSYQKKTHIIV